MSVLDTRISLALLLSLGFLFPVQAGNILDKGDFESGPPSWANFQDKNATIEESAGYQGSLGARVLDGYPWGQFPVPGASGQMFKLSFMGKGSGFLVATALIDGNNNGWHAAQIQSTEWRRYAITFLYPDTEAENPQVRLYANPAPREGGEVWLDNIEFTRLGAESDRIDQAANEELIDLLHDGGVETGAVEDNLAPAGWRIDADHTGYLRHTGEPNVYSGKLAVEAKVFTENKLYGIHEPAYLLGFQGPSVPVGSPKTVLGRELVQYWIRFMAKGEGNLKIGWHDLDNADAVMGNRLYAYKTLRIDGAPLTPDWQAYEIVYRPTDRNPTAKRMCLQFVLEGKGAHVFIDNLSIRYDPDVVEVGSQEPNPFSVDLAGHQVTFECRVAGEPVVDGRGALAPPGGVIAITAKGQGDGPGIGGRIIFEDGGSVEVDPYWKISTTPADGWDRADFDDSDWAPVTLRETPDGETVMWAEGGEHCFFRRHILWQAGEYRMPVSPNLPFAEGFANWFRLTLNPPVSGPMTSYQFVVEMPESFELVDPLKGANDSTYSRLPIQIESEQAESQNRYRIHFNPEHVTGASRTRKHASLIMIKQVAPLRDPEAAIHTYRIANGNVSDLRTTIPIKTVPTPDGTRPKRIILHDWVYPWVYLNAPAAQLSVSYGDEIMKLEVAAGITHISFDWRDYYAPSPDNERHRALHRYWKMLADTGIEATQIEHDGLLYLATEPSPVVDFLEARPEYRARFFNDIQPEGRLAAHSPNLAKTIGDGGEAYWESVRATYRKKIDAFENESGIPVKAILWDLEFPPRNFTTTPGSVDFSEANKEHFRAWAKIPADQPLTDDIIAGKYTGLWHRWTWEVRQQEYVDAAYRNCFQGEDSAELWVYLGQGMKYLPGMADVIVVPIHQSSRPIGNLQPFCDQFERYMLGDRSVTWLHILGETNDRQGRFPHRWEVMAIDIIKSAFATHGGGTSYFHDNPGFTANLFGFAEAARLLAKYESFFIEGKHLFAGHGLDDFLTFESPPPDHGALQLNDEILLLLFNESDEPFTPRVTLADGGKPEIVTIEPWWYTAINFETPHTSSQ